MNGKSVYPSLELNSHEAPTPWSRLYLPALASAPSTILGYLAARFQHVSPEAWAARAERGLVKLEDGTTVQSDSAYRSGVTVLYRREVLSEPAPVQEPAIIYRDEHIVVADKPHGMVVTPAGNLVERSLLVWLRRTTGLFSLAPLHRLDRDTAGLVLLSIQPVSRGPYHRLFSQGAIEREYRAVARVTVEPEQKQWRIENRIARGVPFFRQQIVDGPANAVTDIKILAWRDGLGLFCLRPSSGKKHQLRLHMSSLGYPILGDALYPTDETDETPAGPQLQLLAQRLSFIDPINGAPQRFISIRQLSSLCF
jgi:tRNA pseudouridine32 synthase/23S rRNA pseudouridine746 synthase